MSDVIREFLVSLGFRIDANGLRRFQDAVTGSTSSVMGLGNAAISAGVQMGDALEKMTKKYESLQYASQRTGATVQSLQAVAYAASQVGMSAEEGAAAMESFAEAMRKNPGIEGGLVSQYGKVQGDKAKEFISFIKGVKKELGDTDVGYSVAHRIAELAGIPEHTFYQIFKNTEKFEKKFDEFNDRQTEGGFDPKTFAEKSVKFQDSLGGLGASLLSMRERFYSGFIDPAQASVEWLDKLTRAVNRSDWELVGKIIDVPKLLDKGVSSVLSKKDNYYLHNIPSSTGAAPGGFYDRWKKDRHSQDAETEKRMSAEFWGRKPESSSATLPSGANASDLDVIAMIESGGRANARTGRYKGKFQLSDEEFQKYGGGDIYNATDNQRAAASALEAHKAAFRRRHGRDPNLTELYLMHQQGEGGLDAHMAHPNQPAWMSMYSTAEGRRKGSAWARKAIWGNVPNDMKGRYGGASSITSQEFMDLWGDKVNRFSARLGGGPGWGAQTVPAASEPEGSAGNSIAQHNNLAIHINGITDPEGLRGAMTGAADEMTRHLMIRMDAVR